MSKSKIEWTDETWNPITGCTPISDGCANCYAKRMALRLRGRCGYPSDDPFRVTFHPDKLNYPLTLKKPRRIFVCSMGDLFHRDVRPEWINSVFEIIGETPQHTYLILTKRPHLMESKIYSYSPANPIRELGDGDFLPNVWVGFSACNQADLLANGVNASSRDNQFFNLSPIRFISFEPLLERVTVKNIPRNINWLIVGSETGAGARPMNLDWAREIRDEARKRGIPFFFKKAGKDERGKDRETPEDLQIREFPIMLPFFKDIYK